MPHTWDNNKTLRRMQSWKTTENGKMGFVTNEWTGIDYYFYVFYILINCLMFAYVKLSCEGPLGKTSLFAPPPTPGQYMRPESDIAQPKCNPADVKKQMGY